MSGADFGPGGPPGPPGTIRRRLMMLMVAVAAVIAFLSAAPALERLPGLGARIEVLRESGVDAGAFWWADVPQVKEGERHIRRSQ